MGSDCDHVAVARKLRGNSLSGVLPSQWGALTALTLLDLTNNPILGSLPDSWSNLTGLETL